MLPDVDLKDEEGFESILGPLLAFGRLRQEFVEVDDPSVVGSGVFIRHRTSPFDPVNGIRW